jgi:hypothetical protein
MLLVAAVATLLWLNIFQLPYLILIAAIFGVSDAFLYSATLTVLPRLINRSPLSRQIRSAKK